MSEKEPMDRELLEWLNNVCAFLWRHGWTRAMVEADAIRRLIKKHRALMKIAKAQTEDKVLWVTAGAGPDHMLGAYLQQAIRALHEAMGAEVVAAKEPAARKCDHLRDEWRDRIEDGGCPWCKIKKLYDQIALDHMALIAAEKFTLSVLPLIKAAQGEKA